MRFLGRLLASHLLIVNTGTRNALFNSFKNLPFSLAHTIPNFHAKCHDHFFLKVHHS